MIKSADEKGAQKVGWIRQIYDRSLLWVQSPSGVWALFLIAVAESSFFPIPPDVFLIVLCISVPRSWVWVSWIPLA
jgi:membrane protein YqaA with SNARE-associated domain